ncbi:alkaline phosphatase D family protein [Rhodococcus rhodochrous]|uniref:alkaline phosphatase D family protein n=1 Tax=Rhodococcus rhodochrous TaxID=1829 RepID=UPI001E590638|nr:alkaline phosphatase D family protein [Rhodococcus rhodochrous]MCD2095935.1 alkaline phosphatase family protein [Rhodococcus rhodochrous]MCD2120693.1 alkaline phosphatase family protein [Rhodococcus rhodochrous]MCQ4135724.1 alkaline phosphatase family protein [Rhodococcus rhodochrous]MDJ0017559.1 alkaline phosphatase D family protein [Rhodococcus rhodochrous]
MADLVLGPVLRHIGDTDATIWVETSEPCTVHVLGSSEHTWTVAGHHYALVTVRDLESGSVTPYEVDLDGRVVWPPVGVASPLIRTAGDDPEDFVLAFGSCRVASESAEPTAVLGKDALVAYAQRMRSLPVDEWPDALLLLGDQVYADELSEEMKRRVGERHDLSEPPGAQVRDFEEYTWLYSRSWSEDNVRWLLSNVPTSMIFDDHDVHDDWNTSYSWRREMEASAWWEERIVGALASYWIYQHLGNLSPAELDEDPLYDRVRNCAGDAEPILRAFASGADEEADGSPGVRWSYRRDFGPVRLLVIDSRCGRVLAPDRRDMVSDPEFDWIEEQADGDYDHLLIGTSLPWLLPRTMHDLEAWDEKLASGARGDRWARWAEKLRRAADLEHWAAFRDSFERLARLLLDVAAGRRAGTSGRAPATICALSGDVHHAYAARVRFATPTAGTVYQLTCSPLHNHVPAAVRVAFRAAWGRKAERVVRLLLGPVTAVPEASFSWSKMAGPSFGNQIATLRTRGRVAHLTIERSVDTASGPHLFETVTDLPLTTEERPPEIPTSRAASRPSR